jgi:uncharacterized protein (TIGR01777 family)
MRLPGIQRVNSRRHTVKVVVTGGTGFIGRKLVRALLDRGDAVAVLTRDAAGARPTFDPRVAVETWGPSADGPWKGVIASADAVVHLAGAGVLDERWSKERLALIRSSRVEPTQWLAAAIANAPLRPRVLVSGSAVGIYGMRRDDNVLDEQAPHGDDVLAAICEEWEGATDEATRAGVRVAIPRIGIVMGLEGGALAKMIGPFKAFVGGPVGDGAQWVSWIHWRDVVRGILFAIDHDDFGGPFNLSAPKPVTMEDFAHALGAALHRPAAIRVPALALRAAIGPGADAILTGQRAVPVRLERAGFTFEFEELLPALRSVVCPGMPCARIV